ncbi:histone-lysine N-methyltransferase 2D-like [Heteronotia binoei]|uniref:histone-lysine N-methyltransferase 2D-like n=1 Tax=Heteronotia binoei TaxID=13085 RepID=UPI00292F439F|nr:histone-lysine N-methyltransferase 2D-like [Heteronotia binoei]
MDVSPPLEEPFLPPQPENVLQFPASETAESSPPSQMNTEVQTSLLDVWKTKDLRDARAQTSWMDMSPPLEEPPLPPQPENVLRFPGSETAESSPPSQINTEMQTSLLDVWKTKDLRDARAQTSWMDMSPPLEEPPLPPQPENVLRFPASETAESSPPSHINTEVQTSLLDIWKTKDVSDSLAQTSQLDMSKSVEESLPPQSENVVQSSTPKTTKSPLPSQADTEAQTSFFDIWKAKELSDGQMQTSWSGLPESMEEPLLQPQSKSPMQIATAASPSPDQLDPEKQTSLLEMWKAREPMESSELPTSSPSPTDTTQQSLEELPRAQMLPSEIDMAGAALEPTVLSRTASPAHLPMPAKVEAALPVQMDSQLPTSLLEVWTTRQEAEVQMQTANLGLSFDRDSPLFPMLVEGQEEKKPERISKVEGKPKLPILTEAQVQTSFVEIPRGKKWRSSRLCTEAQVQTSFPDLRLKDRMPALQKMVSDHVSAKRVQKGPKRATPVSVHLHVKMSPKRRTSNEQKVANT